MQSLRKYKIEYIKADNDQKKMLASAIRHEFADCNREDFPADLRLFLSELDAKDMEP